MIRHGRLLSSTRDLNEQQLGERARADLDELSSRKLPKVQVRFVGASQWIWKTARHTPTFPASGRPAVDPRWWCNNVLRRRPRAPTLRDVHLKEATDPSIELVMPVGAVSQSLWNRRARSWLRYLCLVARAGLSESTAVTTR